MPFAVSGKIEGLGELVKRLAGVSAAVRKKLLKQAINAATRAVLREAKALAPIGETKLLRRSLGRKTKVYRHSGTVVGIVGPRVGYKTAIRTVTRGPNRGKEVYANPTQYAHLVELGTTHSRAKPFLAPAFAQAQAPALAVMTEIISAGIEKAAAEGK